MNPFYLARKFSSLDHISGGRVGWNIVTSGSDEEAQNFSLEKIPDHKDRYVRAKEFVEVVTRLWDSWEDDALVLDKKARVYAEVNKVHEINHQGSVFSVKGPLNVPHGPQGRPVLVQAGSSEDGKDFAATMCIKAFVSPLPSPYKYVFLINQEIRVMRSNAGHQIGDSRDHYPMASEDQKFHRERVDL